MVNDLRRTAASLMVGAGVRRLVVSKILNHVETGVTALCHRQSYDQKKRAAFRVLTGIDPGRRWADALAVSRLLSRPCSAWF